MTSNRQQRRIWREAFRIMPHCRKKWAKIRMLQAKGLVAEGEMQDAHCPINKDKCTAACVHFRRAMVTSEPFRCHDGSRTRFVAYDPPRCKLWGKK